jgi:MFS family permease
MEAPIVKNDRAHLEHTSSDGDSDSQGHRDEKDIGYAANTTAYAEFPDILDDSHDARIIRKVDRHVVPWLAVLYAWSLIDRTNMGNAQIEGMSQELRLNIQNRYSIALLVFFPTYFVSELPATLLVRHVSPRLVITAIALAWGTTMIAMGFVKVWGALAGLRALLGLLEGGYFPICVFLLSSWYKRYELQKRITFFYMFGVLASGLSSILAYGLARIGPRGNYRPWSFIFFCEGAITVCQSCVVESS